MKENIEQRLDDLREEARRNGAVAGRGVDISGGPIPRQPRQGKAPGYFGEGVVRPPVWTWEIPLYFFVGGMAGMAASVGCAAWMFGQPAIAAAAFWIAASGAMISPVLLIMDLGRPRLFLHMLRVFKIRSPMSVGAWVLSAFGAHAVPGAILFELFERHSLSGLLQELVFVATILAVAGAAFWGLLLATYTGVLLGATVIPAWFLHRATLPVHFGIVGLGSAAGSLELLGYRNPALAALGYFCAGVELILWLLLECSRHGAADRAVHSGVTGWMVRGADLCTGPIALGLRLAGLMPVAAVVFMAGGLLSRFGWIEAGRASGKDPEAVFASQGAG
jgi:hypothetical protein